MSDTNLYGPIISGRQVRKAVIACLEFWLDDYLGEIERVEGYEPNQIQRPLAVISTSDVAKFTEDQIPLVGVVNQGLASKPVRRADGHWEASWIIGVAAIVSDQDPESTRDLADAYLAAIRLMFLQHKKLTSALHPQGFAQFTDWHDETYGDVAFTESRTIGAGRSLFEVGVENVAVEFAGPRAPLADPTVSPEPLPAAEKLTVIGDHL